MTTTEMKAVIAANLDDNRILAIQLFLTDLIEREKFGGGVERYRIKNTLTDQYVTSLTEFKNQVDPDSIKMSMYQHTDRMAGDRTNPTVVVLPNFVVELTPHS